MGTHPEQRGAGRGWGPPAPLTWLTPGRPISCTPQVQSRVPSSLWSAWDSPRFSSESPTPQAHQGRATAQCPHSMDTTVLQHFILLKLSDVCSMRGPLTPIRHSVLYRCHLP